MARSGRKPRSARRCYDVVVVGAGAAGLSAAAELSRSDLDVCILDARDRLGGRVYTRIEADAPAPLELGAEFVHGRAAVTIDWLRQANSTIVDISGARFTLVDGSLQPSDGVFEDLKRGLARIRLPRKDLPLAQFLEGPARRALKPRARELMRALVEGFDAADPTRISTRDVFEEWRGQGAADAPTFRPYGGYSVLIAALARTLAGRADIRLNAPVQEVRWRRGAVAVDAAWGGEPFCVESRCAVIALPLGVLQLPPQAAGAVRFTPALSRKRAAFAALASGPVIKALLRFREPFWESIDGGRYCNATFFHAPGAPFPTFWTSLPMRSSVLTAWAAGPNAVRLSGKSQADLLEVALASLKTLFGRRAPARDALTGVWLHDWQADRYACGAYSYVIVGGAAARRRLAAPLDGALFFAGEAADFEGEAGTVAGALQSGERAAAEVLRALNAA